MCVKMNDTWVEEGEEMVDFPDLLWLIFYEMKWGYEMDDGDYQ